MKIIISISLIILFNCSPSYSQFQKEAEYPRGSFIRVLLQNQSERYFYFDEDDKEIKVADASHQIINSIPTACDIFIGIYTARSDFETIDLGVLCSCIDTLGQFKIDILDQDGNIFRRFNRIPYVDDRYIIVFDKENNHNSIYDVRSLELIKEIPQIELKLGSKTLNDDDYYYGYNNVDSIFIFDSSLSKVKGIDIDFIASQNNVKLLMASIVENNETSFYFLVTEFTPNWSALSYRLIDENGAILHEFSNSPTLHKYEQKLQAVHFLNQGISTYDVNEKKIV